MQAKASMYVYRIRSQEFKNQVYVGITKDFRNRLKSHNEGKSSHTSKYKPWSVEVVLWFSSESKARAFEKYLKSGSGRAFTTKHF